MMKDVQVGAVVTNCAPHRSVREQLTHTVPQFCGFSHRNRRVFTLPAYKFAVRSALYIVYYSGYRQLVKFLNCFKKFLPYNIAFVTSSAQPVTPCIISVVIYLPHSLIVTSNSIILVEASKLTAQFLKLIF